MLTLLSIDGLPPRVSPGPDMTQYLGVCVGLIALVVVCGWGFKRLFARSLAARAAQRSLQVLDMLPLGGKQRLAVVRCYERTFVVGLGDKELCMVAELDPQATAELDSASVEPRPSPADQSAFQRLLRTVRAKPPKQQREPGLASEGLLG